MDYYYYLHFEKMVSPQVVGSMFSSDPHAEIQKIFDSSFDISTSLSFSKVKHLVKTNFPDSFFYLLQARRGDYRSNSEPTPVSIASISEDKLDEIVVNVSDFYKIAQELTEDGMKYVKLWIAPSDNSDPNDVIPPSIEISACTSEDSPEEVGYDSIEEADYRF